MTDLFIDKEHERKYRELLRQLGGNADHGYQVLSYILSAPRMEQPAAIYLGWRRRDDGTWKELWDEARVLSHGQQLLLKAAANLFSGDGTVNLADLCSVLDRKNFNIFQRALLIYRYGEARLMTGGAGC